MTHLLHVKIVFKFYLGFKLIFWEIEKNKTQFNHIISILINLKLLTFLMFLNKNLKKLKKLESIVKKKNQGSN